MGLTITNLQRRHAIPVSKIKAAAQLAAKKLKIPPPESIVFVGPERMCTLNKKYLGHDYATDVITFKHGEIVICPAMALRNAKHEASTLAQELMLYVVHGVLHLAGYTDQGPKGRARMRQQERAILKTLM